MRCIEACSYQEQWRAPTQVYQDVASAEDRCLAYAQLAVTAAERQGYAAAERVRCPPLALRGLTK